MTVALLTRQFLFTYLRTNLRYILSGVGLHENCHLSHTFMSGTHVKTEGRAALNGRDSLSLCPEGSRRIRIC